MHPPPPTVVLTLSCGISQKNNALHTYLRSTGLKHGDDVLFEGVTVLLHKSGDIVGHLSGVVYHDEAHRGSPGVGVVLMTGVMVVTFVQE